MGTIKTTNIEPIADNGTVTLGSSGDQFTLATGAKSSFLYPAFEAYLNTDQTVGDGTATKVQFDVEKFDTDNCYDNSTNYRFTPTVAGKYYVYASVYGRTATSANLEWVITYIYKNGVAVNQHIIQFSGNPARQASVDVFSVIDMNGSTDYLEIFGNVNTTSVANGEFEVVAEGGTHFGAYRIGS